MKKLLIKQDIRKKTDKINKNKPESNVTPRAIRRFEVNET